MQSELLGPKCYNPGSLATFEDYSALFFDKQRTSFIITKIDFVAYKTYTNSKTKCKGIILSCSKRCADSHSSSDMLPNAPLT